MDPSPLIDGAIQVIQSNPKTVGLISIIPITQIVAGVLVRIPFIKRKHSTWFNRALTYWSRWPGPKPQP